MLRTMLVLIVGAGIALGANHLYSQGYKLNFSGLAFGQPNNNGTGNSPGLGELGALSDRFEAVAKLVLPAVVSIEAKKVSTPLPGATSRTSEDSGTGVIIASADGLGAVVITNNHVIAGARNEQIHINLADGRLMKPLQVWGDAETDIAVMKVEGSNLPAARLGDSDRVRIGQWVLALGSPFGLSQSVTHGIISARERGQVTLGNTIRVKDFLQTDAAINPGSSGGPLVNLSGEVIGINTAIASQSGSSAGVSFSIPVNLVKRVAKQLQERGVVSHGYLGLQLDPQFEPATAVNLGLDRARGARIAGVVPESPGAQAGLKANDVVLQVDTVSIRNDNHLINLISMLPPTQRIRLQVWREKKAMAVDAVVGDWNSYKGRFRQTSNQ
jgi:serine protease Do